MSSTQPTTTTRRMPAFDPVRDAVLNSPVLPPHSLPSPALATPSSTTTQWQAYFPPSPSPVPTSIASPTSLRRATDLAVLLNTDGPSESSIPSLSLPHQSARPSNLGRRSSHLSHILHPESYLDERRDILQPSISRTIPSNKPQPKISTDNLYSTFVPPASGSTSSSTSSSAHQPPKVQNHLQQDISSDTGGRSSLPTASKLTRHNISSIPSSSNQMPSSSTSVPAFSGLPIKRSSIPYAPRHRRTDPGRVLVPLSAAEYAVLKNLNKNPLRGSLKRKREVESREDRDDVLPTKRLRDSAVVVEHYNARPDVGVVQRRQSPIIGLKSFNNWVKSVLITRFAHPVLRSSTLGVVEAGPSSVAKRKSHSSEAPGGKVLDLGCGKGGDLNKWQKARVREYFGLDIAAVSVEQARSRYVSSHSSSAFHAVFNTLDCYTHPLTDAIPPSELPPNSKPFDIVSMQFCMHYAFESLEKTRMMLENVTRWLKTGGVFVGTVPNASMLLEHLDKMPPDTPAEDLSFGNNVYRIRFDPAYRKSRPLFGHRYWFFLTDAVEDVPEYIVYWDHFVHMAEEYSLRLLYKAEFHEVYQEHHEHPEFGPLLQRMHVVNSKGESQMDEEQWDAANVYIAFAFEKQ